MLTILARWLVLASVGLLAHVPAADVKIVPL